jgi:hypothetical protein
MCGVRLNSAQLWSQPNGGTTTLGISRETTPTKQSAVYTLIRIIPGIVVKGLLQSAQHVEDLILSLIGSASSTQGMLQQTKSRKVWETKQ